MMEQTIYEFLGGIYKMNKHEKIIKKVLEENRKRFIENNKQKAIDKITKEIKARVESDKNVRKCY